MKFFCKRTDGGPQSNVTGYWLLEIKSLFSVALLSFDEGSREAYHSHAFNSISWLIIGELLEDRIDAPAKNRYTPSIRPIITTRGNLHKVYGFARRSWVLTFRGPWAKTWVEQLPTGEIVTLTNGRIPVEVT